MKYKYLVNCQNTEYEKILRTFEKCDWRDKNYVLDVPAIYIFANDASVINPEDEQIFYIGQTKNLNERMRNHNKPKELVNKDFKIYWKLCLDDNRRIKIEYEYIQLFQPFYNKQFNPRWYK